MAPLPGGVTYGQWSAVYTALSFSIAAMGSATIFFCIEMANVHKKFHIALPIELILVMGLPAEQTASLSWQLGTAAAVMVALGYPGEIQDNLTQHWLW